MQTGCDLCGNPEQFFQKILALENGRKTWERENYNLRNQINEQEKLKQDAEWFIKNSNDRVGIEYAKKDLAEINEWLRQAYQKLEDLKAGKQSLDEISRQLQFCDNNCNVRDTLPSRDEDTPPSIDMPGAPAGSDLDKSNSGYDSDSSLAGKRTLPSPPPTNSPCAGVLTGQHCETPYP